MLSEALPTLRNASPGKIQEEKLPDLRNFVVVDNTGGLDEFQTEIEGVRSAIDFRELMLWQEDVMEKQLHQQMKKSLHENEVINLQFTRSVLGSTVSNRDP